MPQFYSKFHRILSVYKEEQKKTSFVSFEKIPSLLSQSVICIEDRRFYQHHGIDPVGIFRAFFTNLLNRKILEGASTITQQLVRQLTLSKKKSYLRKFNEIIISLLLEHKLSKKQILELYLNTCYLGSHNKQDIHGIENASIAVLGKSLSSLTLGEITLLAALIGRPLSNSSSTSFFMRTICRQHLILKHLKNSKFIDEADQIQAQSENIKLFNLHKNDLPIDTVDQFKRNYIRPANNHRLIQQLFRLCLRRYLYDRQILTISRKHQIPFRLIKKIIKHESSYVETSVSKKGAKGLMQLLEPTFLEMAKRYKKSWKIEDIYKPEVNIEAGTLYFKFLHKYFTPKSSNESSVQFALAAYNVGLGTVNKAIEEIKKNDAEITWDNLQSYIPTVTINYVNSILK